MKRRLVPAAVVVLALGFVGVFWWAYGRPGVPVSAKNPLVTTLVGVAGRYSYVITHHAGEHKMTAEFNPAIVNDDSQVIDALHAVMSRAYSAAIDPKLQPVVEDINERHYVTFVTDHATTVFDLKKQSTGEVQSAVFWREEQ